MIILIPTLFFVLGLISVAGIILSFGSKIFLGWDFCPRGLLLLLLSLSVCSLSVFAFVKLLPSYEIQALPSEIIVYQDSPEITHVKPLTIRTMMKKEKIIEEVYIVKFLDNTSENHCGFPRLCVYDNVIFIEPDTKTGNFYAEIEGATSMTKTLLQITVREHKEESQEVKK